MRGTSRGGPDTDLVVAARDGDRAALDTLLATSLPLVRHIVGHALRGHADVDDVVQETLLRVVRHLPHLRDPAAFRSWLVAIAVRQVREREELRRAAARRSTDLDVARELPDPAGDFVATTILRLGLTDQRREVAEATRWLDPDDRTLLALWWLEATGELSRAGLADALDVSVGTAAVRIRRLKEQLRIGRTVVRALRDRPGCPRLHDVAAAWDGHPSPLWRKRLARHIRDCARCRRHGAGLLPVDRLLAGLPLTPVPAALVDRCGATAGPASTQPAAPAGRVDGPGRSGPGGSMPDGVRRGGLRRGGLRSGLRVPAAAAVAACVLAGALLATRPGRPEPVRTESLAGPAATATTAPPAPSVTPVAPTPSRSAAGRRPSARPAPAVAAVPSARKGVGVWTFPGVSQALAASGAGWYHTWNTTHDGIRTPAGAEFVPMIWGAKNVDPASLARARNAGTHLLGFNEPDLGGQANLTPEQALDLWPKLMSTGRILGSPAVAAGGADPGGWLDRFLTGARSRGYRVDFIAVHWYGGDFRTAAAVRQLRSYLDAVHARYGLPIWLTEFALIDFTAGRFPTAAEQAAFLTAATTMLDGLPYLRRYAWFGLPATDRDRSGLFRGGPLVTEVGRAFQRAR
jgi:RNA polymerase sigma factor (sigma-70 family)